MRFITFSHNGSESFGCVQGDHVSNLGTALGNGLRSLKAVIEANALLACEEALTRAPKIPLSEVTYLPPVRNPGKILCVGINYMDRNDEYRGDIPCSDHC